MASKLSLYYAYCVWPGGDNIAIMAYSPEEAREKAEVFYKKHNLPRDKVEPKEPTIIVHPVAATDVKGVYQL